MLACANRHASLALSHLEQSLLTRIEKHLKPFRLNPLEK